MTDQKRAVDRKRDERRRERHRIELRTIRRFLDFIYDDNYCCPEGSCCVNGHVTDATDRLVEALTPRKNRRASTKQR